MLQNKISVELNEVGKKYPISPTYRVGQIFKNNMFKKYKDKNISSGISVLDHISFKIKTGECFGIIGANGAGKSTLLQVISGLITPTSGTVSVNGRIAALLELGAGFNPEFTGVENVYFNAALLGLTKQQIDDKYDEIVEFSGLGSSIRQKIKTYSSGMIVRLAFSIIVHSNPDILIIDEALAVGDAFFVRKCMKFLTEFKTSGTLIVVSHDLDSVKTLCDTVLWLENGSIREIGVAKTICDSYFEFVNLSYHSKNSISNDANYRVLKNKASVEIDQSCQLNHEGFNKSAASVVIKNVEIINNSASSQVWHGGEKSEINVELEVFKYLIKPIIGFLVRDKYGRDLFGYNTNNIVDVLDDFEPGDCVDVKFKFAMPKLVSGEYTISISVAINDSVVEQIVWETDYLVFKIEQNSPRWGVFELDDVEIKVANK